MSHLSRTWRPARFASLLLVAALMAPPLAAASPETSSPVLRLAHVSTPARSVVTLLTGDRVSIRSLPTGQTVATVLPGSPHAGDAVRTVRLAADLYVVPHLDADLARRLDPSVFNVDDLRRSGREARLWLTFPRGRLPELPGLSLDRATRHPVGATRARVAATYDPTRPLPAALTDHLTSVISVRGTTPTINRSGRYDLHTVTLQVGDGGDPVDLGSVSMLNTDNGHLFGAFLFAVDGEVKVAAPEGHYYALGDDWARATAVEFTVATTDRSVSLDLAQATTRPEAHLAGHVVADEDLFTTREAAVGGVVSDGWSGVVPLISPLSPPPAGRGTLHTGYGATFMRPGSNPDTTSHLAVTREEATGIPRTLSFTYQRDDFATVLAKSYSPGRPLQTYGLFYGFAPHQSFGLIWSRSIARPGIVRIWYAGAAEVSWYTLISGADRGLGGEMSDLSRFRAGQRAERHFFRSPFGPVAEEGGNSARVGPSCLLCVSAGRLHGRLSMLSSAATHTSGSLYDPAESSWRVAAGTRILDQGTEFIAPDIAHVPTGQELTLTAASTPAGPPVTVSSKVSDEFTFTVSAGDAVVPILRPRYVPPTGLDSTLDPGPVSYRLSFDNLGPLSARVKTASLEFSLNGRSWTPARLTRLSKNSFRVTYHSPAATRRHRAVSLRVAGADSAGRTVREEVTDAYLTSAARTPARQATAADARRGFDPDRLCRTTGRTTYSCFVTLQRVLGRAGKALTRGWGADELRDAYGIPDGGADTTVGVVIAHDYPHAERDLNHYRARFGLPPCTTANGCFRKINQRGEQGNYPTFDPGWSVEGALDLQMVSAACPTCSIVLAEANQPTDKPLNRAIAAAINAGATVTNHSYGRSETTGITDLNAWYSRPGVTAVAASGDSGFQPATFPASSPDVVAVGGTTLARSLNTPRGWTERAWTNAGSGCSAYFAKPGWQSDPSCHNRSYADLSAAAFNIDIFVTSVPRPYRGWLLVGGTSASSPLVAGLIGAAGADGMRPDHLYADSTRFVDITHGSNGYCQGNYLCTAGPGFDGPTGWGTPRGLAPFQP